MKKQYISVENFILMGGKPQIGDILYPKNAVLRKKLRQANITLGTFLEYDKDKKAFFMKDSYGRTHPFSGDIFYVKKYAIN